MADGHVIWVEFDLEPGRGGEFMRLVEENAVRSVADEAGCRRFDVLTGRDGGDKVALYEIYDDAAAFDVHLASPHYHRFDAASADMVRAKRVAVYVLREHAK